LQGNLLNTQESTRQLSGEQIADLRLRFGDRLQAGVPLARFTAARLGGPADYFLEVRTAGELAQAAGLLWEWGLPFHVLGGGSNVLISDSGVRGMVLLNRANSYRFDGQAEPPTVWAESGANLGLVARHAAQHGLAGLEWAAGIPGTVGGAVVGNAGAHGGDMAGSLQMAEILHHNTQEAPARREKWPVEHLDYAYRNSVLKRSPGDVIVLSAVLNLEKSSPEVVKSRIDQFVAYRRRTQPPGASMGSMFKNPPGDYAGRLIEAVGLKGARRGDAQISPLHANFFINQGNAKSADVYDLIRLAQQAVLERASVNLELEIELLGEW
jgi:UDP-N-acetylmuramate dehydrogenase